jgi:hypothetical protein
MQHRQQAVQVSAVRVGVFWLGRLCVSSKVQWHSSGYVGLSNLGSESETCVGTMFVLLESPSPSRRILIGSHSLPPLWFVVSVLHEVATSYHPRGRDPTSWLLTVKIRQPSHEFTFGVGMTFVSYSLVLTPVV